jgi:hypothetical protein
MYPNNPMNNFGAAVNNQNQIRPMGVGAQMTN